jgi:aminoglycoside/choline kinase family phosphotransferase
MAPGKDDRLSSDREAEKAAFLAEHGLADASRETLAGDASTRLYERLHRTGGASLIFMDQPPKAETQPCPPDATPAERIALGYNAIARLAAGRVEAFIAVDAYLKSLGFSAPEIIASDASAGLAVLEDLGDGVFARLMEVGEDETPLYDGAVDCLVRLHAETPPERLVGGGVEWPLLTFDDLALQVYGEALFLEWWPQYVGQPAFSADAAAEWDALWAPIRARGVAGASVFCHRDYHAENLVWLPKRQGVARVGMLDFQDAVRAHPVWDMSMLLHDARRDVSPEREAAVLARYLGARPKVDREAFVADFHALGALNCTRILFIFARQVVGFGRPRYAAFMPRMWRYLDLCLAAPDMAPLKAWFAKNVRREAAA